ncbi:hypothetical protein [Vibrio coralliilyticus]|uniref:hypothetical protein n=1 Tax=Vibrio coralliilyticus TaxID=190893 RepID=UPI000C17248A|nr:hypothetical protein [Vibrio coralliilyticus]
MDEKFLLAVVAASSAVGGVLITQLFTILKEILIARNANRTLVRDKYEEFVDCLNESVIHRTKVANIVCDEEFHRSLLNLPLQRAYKLSLIYFPEFIEPLKECSAAYKEFCMTLGRSLVVGGTVSVGLRASHDQGEEMDAVMDKINLTQNELDQCVRKYARKYTRA